MRLSIRCSSCDHSIPFWGTACPYCGFDKGKDQIIYFLTIMGIMIAGGFVWKFLGFPGLFLVAGLIYLTAKLVRSLKRKRSHEHKQTPMSPMLEN